MHKIGGRDKVMHHCKRAANLLQWWFAWWFANCGIKILYYCRDICLPFHFRQLLKSPSAGPVRNFGVHQKSYKGSSRECSTRVIFKKGLLVAELEAKRCYKAVAWGGKLTSPYGGSLYLPRQVPTGSIHIAPRILSQSMTPPLVNFPSCCISREFCILCSSQDPRFVLTAVGSVRCRQHACDVKAPCAWCNLAHSHSGSLYISVQAFVRIFSGIRSVHWCNTL